MAFPFAVNLDPLSVLEFMAGLSEDECDDEQYVEDSSDDEDEFSEGVNPLSTQEGMVRRFRAMRARFVQSGGVFTDQAFAGNTRDDADATPDTTLLRTLKPMTCKELEVGKTHRGQYLCGWVAIDDAFFGVATSSLILEDLTGDLVEIVAYGLVDPELLAQERQCILSRRFAKGQPIVVIEPHYKDRLDESKAIRVDHADKLFAWRDAPTDLMTWKELGNEFFSVRETRDEGRGALECYQRALKAAQSEVHTLAILLTNLATCRFKTGDFGTAIQLSGAAVHLDPTYFKGWFRLASATAKSGLQSLAARIAAHAHEVWPGMSFEELQLLKKTLKSDASSSRTATNPPFQSLAEWCVKLEMPGSVLAEGDLSGETKSADEWRKEGSAHFAKGELGAAEKCYRKGLASSRQCNRDISTVLNNAVAVHVKAFRETSAGSGGSANSEGEIPHSEAALLNCTVAGIIDPLNFKAWLRRARCLQNLGFTQEICIRDLQAIRTSVVSMTVFSKATMERLNAFQRCLDGDIQKRLQHSSGVKPDRVLKEPQPKQCQERDTNGSSNAQSYEHDRSSGVPPGKEDDIDDSIARLDEFVRSLRSIYAGEMSPSRPRLRELPHEIKTFLHDTPPKIQIEFSSLRGWPEGIHAVYAGKLLYRAYLQATLSPLPMYLSCAMEDTLRRSLLPTKRSDGMERQQ